MCILTVAVLTVLDETPDLGSFRPGYSGEDKTVKFNIADLNDSKLGNLSTIDFTSIPIEQGTGPHGSDDELYQSDTFERMVERLWLDFAHDTGGSYMHPQYNIQPDGGWIARQVGDIALILNSGNYSNTEKKKLLIGFVQVGIDEFSVHDEVNFAWDTWLANGQVNPGRKFPILFAGMILNDYEMLNISDSGVEGVGHGNPGYLAFQEDEQTFYVTEENVNISNLPGWDPVFNPGGAITPYSDLEIGLPEWGYRHAADIYYDNYDWYAAYKSSSMYWGGFVLAAHIMEMKDLWKHDALFDFMDRFVEDGPFSLSPDWNSEMWNLYRADYGCMYDSLNTVAHTRIYNCSAELFDCSLVSSCADYNSNTRAEEYDPCGVGGCVGAPLIYYIDPISGLNTNDGNSTHPWQTIEYAINQTSQGDTIKLRGTNYPPVFITSSELNSFSGHPTLKINDINYITIEPDTGHNPVIVGGDTLEDIAFSIDGGASRHEAYFNFKNIKIQGQARVSNVVGLKFENCEVSGSDEQHDTQNGGGFGIKDSSNVLVDNCTIYHFSNGFSNRDTYWLHLKNSDIYDIGEDYFKTVNDNNLIIEDNIFRNNTCNIGSQFHPDVIQFGPADASTDGFNNNSIIRRNKIYDMKIIPGGDGEIDRIPQGFFVKDSTCDNLTLENNLFLVEKQTYIYQTSDAIIRNNVFYLAWFDDKVGGRPSSNIQFYNNIVINQIAKFGTNPFSYRDYNIANQYLDLVKGPNSTDYPSMDDLKAAVFEDYEAGNYNVPSEIGSGLPRDAGSLAYPAPLTDIDGNLRDANPDIGAYEYQGIPTLNPFTAVWNWIKDVFTPESESTQIEQDQTSETTNIDTTTNIQTSNLNFISGLVILGAYNGNGNNNESG